MVSTTIFSVISERTEDMTKSRTLASNKASKSAILNLCVVDAAPLEAMWKIMLASNGVKTEFLAVAASSKKSVTSILPSFELLVAL